MEPSPWAWGPAWPETVATLLLAAAYAASQRRYPASGRRRLAFGAGVVLILLAFTTPLETLATEYLLSAHLLQNVVLAEWAPLLLVVGVAPAAAAALGRRRLVRWLTRPVVALPLWLVTYMAWHVPAAYDAALRHPSWLLPLEHASYLVAGCALWWSMFQDEPWRMRTGAKAGYAFAAFMLASPIGLLLAFLPEPIYSFYEAAPRVWSLTALRDQQIAGMIMGISEALVFFGVFALFMVRFLQEEEARADALDPARQPRRGPT